MTADNVLFEIKGLKKNFGDLEVLKGIHTTIRKGEVVVVIGPSGSGKSTFIRCLNLLETPTEGQIFFEGSCITDKGYAVHKHREKVGINASSLSSGQRKLTFTSFVHPRCAKTILHAL